MPNQFSNRGRGAATGYGNFVGNFRNGQYNGNDYDPLIIRPGNPTIHYAFPSEQQQHGPGQQGLPKEPTGLVWRSKYPTRDQLEQLKLYDVSFPRLIFTI